MSTIEARATRRAARKRQQAERSRGITVYKCKVCESPVPDAFKQSHHDIPQAAGGSAGPRSNLCAGCHTALHRIADMLTGKRAGLVEDTIKIMYPDDTGAQERLMALARTVVEYMTLKADGHIDLKKPVRVMVELPPEVKLAAQMIANDLIGATGRKLGLATWIASLVKREVFDKYPHLRKTP